MSTSSTYNISSTLDSDQSRRSTVRQPHEDRLLEVRLKERIVDIHLVNVEVVERRHADAEPDGRELGRGGVRLGVGAGMLVVAIDDEPRLVPIDRSVRSPLDLVDKLRADRVLLGTEVEDIARALGGQALELGLFGGDPMRPVDRIRVRLRLRQSGPVLAEHGGEAERRVEPIADRVRVERARTRIGRLDTNAAGQLLGDADVLDARWTRRDGSGGPNGDGRKVILVVVLDDDRARRRWRNGRVCATRWLSPLRVVGRVVAYAGRSRTFSRIALWSGGRRGSRRA